MIKSFDIYSNDPSTPVKTVRLSGKVKPLPAPELTVVPPVINIGSIKNGEPINRDIELTNSGDLDLRITGILTTPYCRAQILSADGKEIEMPEGKGTSAELLITPKSKQVMRITCNPDATKGRFQGNITIKSNARRTPVYVISITGIVLE